MGKSLCEGQTKFPKCLDKGKEEEIIERKIFALHHKELLNMVGSLQPRKVPWECMQKLNKDVYEKIKMTKGKNKSFLGVFCVMFHPVMTLSNVSFWVI
jgi:hypothetical protein